MFILSSIGRKLESLKMPKLYVVEMVSPLSITATLSNRRRLWAHIYELYGVGVVKVEELREPK